MYLFVEGLTMLLHEVHRALQVILFEKSEQGFESALIGSFATPQVWSTVKENPIVASARISVEEERKQEGLSQEDPDGTEQKFTTL